MNYGQRFVTLYRRQGSRPSSRKRNAKKANSLIKYGQIDFDKGTKAFRRRKDNLQ